MINCKGGCLSDKRDNFFRKYSCFLSDNPQLSKHVLLATREAVLGPLFYAGKGDIYLVFKFKYEKMKFEWNELNPHFNRRRGAGRK